MTTLFRTGILFSITDGAWNPLAVYSGNFALQRRYSGFFGVDKRAIENWGVLPCKVLWSSGVYLRLQPPLNAEHLFDLRTRQESI